MRTILVGNNKGGVGKTTISINLASLALLLGLRVLIIDADVQGASMQWSDRRPDSSPLAGVVVVGATIALSLPKFQAIAEGFDVVIIDGPPVASRVTRAAAIAADVVLVPFWPGALDVWASKQMMETLDDANAMRAAIGMPPSRRVLVVNGAVGRVSTVAFTLDGIKDEGEIAPVTIGNRVAFPMSIAAGASVATMYPDSPGAREIESLWTCLGGVS